MLAGAGLLIFVSAVCSVVSHSLQDDTHAADSLVENFLILSVHGLAYILAAKVAVNGHPRNPRMPPVWRLFQVVIGLLNVLARTEAMGIKMLDQLVILAHISRQNGRFHATRRRQLER